MITTARSGTQWLHGALEAIYSDVVIVTHEPMRYAYDPRGTLRDETKLRALQGERTVARHFATIHETLTERSYIETGFPAFTLGPLLRAEFGHRLRIVQLARHPIPVAASLVTHRWYDPEKRPDIAEAVTPVPTDAKVSFGHYAGRWDSMSRFEKALFYWQEVHRVGFEQEAATPPDQFARFRFEDLSGSREAREAFARFVGLPQRAAWSEGVRQRIDTHHRKTDELIDWDLAWKYPEVVKIAERLGYGIDALDPRKLDERYLRKHNQAVNRVRRIARRLAPWRGVRTMSPRSLKT